MTFCVCDGVCDECACKKGYRFLCVCVSLSLSLSYHRSSKIISSLKICEFVYNRLYLIIAHNIETYVCFFFNF